MRGFISGASQFVTTTALDVRDGFQRHFDYFYEDKPWRFRGLYLRLPLIGVALFLEWREVNVGLGWERTSGQDWAFYCGRLQGAVSLHEGGR